MLSGQYHSPPPCEIMGATHAVRKRVNRTNGTRMLGLDESLLACIQVRILSSLPWSGGNFNPCIVMPILPKQGAYIPTYCYEHFLGGLLNGSFKTYRWLGIEI